MALLRMAPAQPSTPPAPSAPNGAKVQGWGELEAMTQMCDDLAVEHADLL